VFWLEKINTSKIIQGKKVTTSPRGLTVEIGWQNNSPSTFIANQPASAKRKKSDIVTLAHEIGHVLLNTGNDAAHNLGGKSDTAHLMTAGKLNTGEGDLKPSVCETMRTNGKANKFLFRE